MTTPCLAKPTAPLKPPPALPITRDRKSKALSSDQLIDQRIEDTKQRMLNHDRLSRNFHKQFDKLLRTKHDLHIIQTAYEPKISDSSINRLFTDVMTFDIGNENADKKKPVLSVPRQACLFPLCKNLDYVNRADRVQRPKRFKLERGVRQRATDYRPAEFDQFDNLQAYHNNKAYFRAFLDRFSAERKNFNETVQR